MINENRKIGITRYFSLTVAILLLFWWPLSHLFYPVWYHALLGFSPGSYQRSMVIVIGICGFLPVMNLFIIAINPVRYKLNIIAMMIFASALMGMYSCLIAKGIFPVRESVNIAASGLIIVAFSIIAPWRRMEKEVFE